MWWVIPLVIVTFILGICLGMVFGINTANTTRVIENTGTRHTKEFNRALANISQRLDAMPEELIDAVREAFPQLYDGPKRRY